MLAFSLVLLGTLVCVAVVLALTLVMDRLTRTDGTPIENPFKGHSVLGQLLIWLLTIALFPLILVLAIGSLIRERFTKPCDPERDIQSPKQQLDAAIRREVAQRKARGK